MPTSRRRGSMIGVKCGQRIVRRSESDTKRHREPITQGKEKEHESMGSQHEGHLHC
jgi:hypothetical protein